MGKSNILTEQFCSDLETAGIEETNGSMAVYNVIGALCEQSNAPHKEIANGYTKQGTWDKTKTKLTAKAWKDTVRPMFVSIAHGGRDTQAYIALTAFYKDGTGSATRKEKTIKTSKRGTMISLDTAHSMVTTKNREYVSRIASQFAQAQIEAETAKLDGELVQAIKKIDDGKLSDAKKKEAKVKANETKATKVAVYKRKVLDSVSSNTSTYEDPLNRSFKSTNKLLSDKDAEARLIKDHKELKIPYTVTITTIKDVADAMKKLQSFVTDK